MSQDDYSGLSRAYSTAPARALSEIAYRTNKLHDSFMTIAHALKHTAWGNEADPAISTQFETANELYELVQELEALQKYAEGAEDEKA